MAKIRGDQDLQFNLTAPTINGTQVLLDQVEWDLEIIGDRAKVRIEKRDELLPISNGTIEATAEIEGAKLKVYAKSSVVAFGSGKLYTQMVIYKPDEHFAEGRKVLKTLRSEVLGVQLV